jgi:hypothetical protein
MDRYYITDELNTVAVFDGMTGKCVGDFPLYDADGLVDAHASAKSLADSLNSGKTRLMDEAND